MDYQGHENIEQWFLNIPKEKFKNQKDYPKIYSLTKDLLNTQVHSEIKAIACSIIPDEFLNNHGEGHVNTVISRASDIIQIFDFDLTPYEAFLLLMGIQLHDAGHIVNGRKEHEKNIAPIIAQLFTTKTGIASIDKIERRYINLISRAHSGKDDPIGKLDEKGQFCSDEFRLRLLAAIIRFADELADDCLRASSFILDIDPEKIGEKSKIFHLYSEALVSCNIIKESREILMVFALDKSSIKEAIQIKDGDKYLIDEIYDRSIKTFNECIYCNRFLPATIRIQTISVKITFVDEKTYTDFFDPISYRLEEKGYPTMNKSSIFDMTDALMENGNKIDGIYIKNKLETNEEESV